MNNNNLTLFVFAYGEYHAVGPVGADTTEEAEDSE